MLVLLATSRAGYGNLSQLVTLARRQASKGSYRLTRADLEQHRHWLEDTLVLIKPKSGSESNFFHLASTGQKFDSDPDFFRQLMPGRCWIACELNRGADDAAHLAALRELSARTGIPLAAAATCTCTCAAARSCRTR